MTNNKTISKCDWFQCKIKNLCKRYKVKINPFKQSWVESVYTKEWGCDLFVNNNLWE